MSVRRFPAAALAAIAAVLTFAAGPALAATVTTVRPSDIGNHWYPADTRPPGSVSIDTTYGGAMGSGAVVLDTSASSVAKAQMLTDLWSGTKLADLTALGYATYQGVAPSGSPVLPALNIRVDLDGNGVTDRYMVYEPYQDMGNAAVLFHIWQTWDAIRGGAAKWWMSGALSPCPQSTPCTWASIVGAYPQAQILEGLDFRGSVGFNQGSSNAGVVGAADALHIAAGTPDVIYDFEPDVVLTSKDACKNGGWATSTAPAYRNQGDCVSSFASGHH